MEYFYIKRPLKSHTKQIRKLYLNYLYKIIKNNNNLISEIFDLDTLKELLGCTYECNKEYIKIIFLFDYL